MRINNLAGTAFAASMVTVSNAADACTNEVELVSPSAPLSTLVKCAAKLSITSGTTNAEYVALYKGCVTALANKVGDDFPALDGTADTDCRACYSDFAKSITDSLVGTVNSSDDFTGGAAIASCKTLANAAEVDECLKSDAIIDAMIDFQSCSGHSINYPAGASLARQRVIYRDDAFVKLTQNAFGNTAELGDILDDVLAHNDVVGATMQTGGELHLDLCLRMYHAELEQYMAGDEDQDIVDVCETIDVDTTDCADSVPVAAALANFADCAGYELQVLTEGCSADNATAMWEWDAYAKIVNCIFNDDEDDPSTDCADGREVLNAAIIEEIGADCGECYVELGEDIQDAHDNGTNTGYNCEDPYSSYCKVRTGLAPITNFKECSGQTLNRNAPVATTTTTTTTEAAATTESTTAAATTTAAPTTTKSSMMVTPLATMVVLALGSALML